MKKSSFKKILTALIDEKRDDFFTLQYRDQATDEETLGIMLAHYFEWDGVAIMRAFSESLEDANFHSETAIVREMIEKYEKE